jgi:hypothetical protein
MQVNNVNDVGITLATACPLFSAQIAAGTTAVAEQSVGSVGPGPQQVAIGAIILQPTGALAISGSAYITVNVYKRTAGGSQTLIGTMTTFTGGTALVAFTPVMLTLQSGAGSYLSPGDTVTIAVTNTGAASQPQFSISGFTKAN